MTESVPTLDTAATVSPVVRVAVLISGHLRGHPHQSCQSGKPGLVPFLQGVRDSCKRQQPQIELDFFVHVWDTMDTALPTHGGPRMTQTAATATVTVRQAAEWFRPLQPRWLAVETQNKQQLIGLGLNRARDMRRAHLLGVKYQYVGMLKALSAAMECKDAVYDYAYRIRADHCNRFTGVSVPNHPPAQIKDYIDWIGTDPGRMLIWMTNGGESSHDVLVFSRPPTYKSVMDALMSIVDQYFGAANENRVKLPRCHEIVFQYAAQTVNVHTSKFKTV